MGDTIAFDVGAPNDVNICRSIYFGIPTTNLGSCPSSAYTIGGWTRITNLQCVGTGDSVIANYDLIFTANYPYSFPGGQLNIGFSIVGAPTDNTCTGTAVTTSCSDASGYFDNRFYNIADLSTYIRTLSPNTIGGFKLTRAC